MRRLHWVFVLAMLLLVLLPAPAGAYVGPGAGFAVAGSFFAVFAALCSAVMLVVTWPIRLIWRLLFGLRARRGRFKRIVILGLDGLDHGLTEKFLAEGKLPHLAALREQGCLRPLGSTLPPISPVAWSSFLTGVNPGKHNIFDFLTPDLDSYRPKLSSVEIRPPRRSLKIGKYQVPLGKADLRMMRKSQPFWSILGKYGIFNSIIRVPITFPPEKLRGVLLSAMCVPDLRGTQGTFSHYTTREKNPEVKTGGEVHHVEKNGNRIRGELLGPADPLRPGAGPLKAPFVISIRDENTAVLTISGARHSLAKDRYTPWIRVRFRAGPGFNVDGICKFLLLATAPHFELYAMPVNIDPDTPAMPVSYPAVYSTYLARQQGSFATLGLAEDTWGLNEHVLSDDHFHRQCVDIDGEREVMFFDALDKVKRGLCVCVFDGSDRLQHMFWRDIDHDHPARDDRSEGRNVIEDLYRRMDDLVGRTVARCKRDDTLLMVISDHGFTTFRRGVDLNRWLQLNGYLTLHEGREYEEFLAGVDWSRSRAFAVGLSGIFINLKGRYAQGIVEPGEEAERLREEIAAKLATLVDEENGQPAVKRAYIAPKVYRGPYKDNAPDLIVGYHRGYRVGWDTAVGRTTDRLFHDNIKAWSGDHCVDPTLVPGVLFCNRKIETESPRLLDLAPTVLNLFGVPIPDYMDGKALSISEAA